MKYAVCVIFQINENSVEEFTRLVTENASKSLEKEEGCLVFDVCTDPAKPQEVFLYEIYTSAEAFGHHLNTEHFKMFDSTIRDMVISKDVKTYSKVM